MSFSQKLKMLMEFTDTSNYRLSKDLNYSASTIANWLNDKTTPNRSKIDQLAKYFNVSVDFLLYDDVSAGFVLNDKNCPEDDYFPDYFDQMPDESQKEYMIKNMHISPLERKLLSGFSQLNEDNQDIIIGKVKELLNEQKQEAHINVAASDGSINKLPDSDLIDKDIQKAKNNKINKL